MTGSMWDLTLAEFCSRLASHEPVPGGGSAAMVSAATGAALVAMALEVTSRKKKAPELAAAALELLPGAAEHVAGLRTDADEDVAAFTAYMAAARLPRLTPDEAATRTAALDSALHRATRAPLDAAARTVAAIEFAAQSLPAVADAVVSDVGAGVALLEGALRAVLLNVDINLVNVKDPGRAAAYSAEREQLQARGSRSASSTLDIVRNRLRT